jgi:hypothetical protein
MNIRTVTLDQEHYLNVYAQHISCPSGSSSAMNVVILGFERVKVLKPSGRHRHCPGMTCLKESVTCGQRPSIRKQRNLDRVCWVLDLAEERWFLSKANTLLLYMLLGLESQPWSGLGLRSRHVKIRSVVVLPVIILLEFSPF